MLDRPLNRIGTAAFAAALCGMSIVAAATDGPGGGNPGCFVNDTTPACDLYEDLTPECGDILLGGGQCGVKPAARG